MEIQNIKRKKRKSVLLSIRTYKDYSLWMKDNDVSPTALFNEAVKELMTKKTKVVKKQQ